MWSLHNNQIRTEFLPEYITISLPTLTFRILHKNRMRYIHNVGGCDEGIILYSLVHQLIILKMSLPWSFSPSDPSFDLCTNHDGKEQSRSRWVSILYAYIPLAFSQGNGFQSGKETFQYLRHRNIVPLILSYLAVSFIFVITNSSRLVFTKISSR